jgi:RNA polymerase sigma factor (sigma-70 family)
MRGDSPTVLRYVRAIYGTGVLSGLSDGQLLERFMASGPQSDPSDAELAFATLMQRHGPLVWRVCRSLVDNSEDAEDAFQATFLVLVRKAGSLRVHQTLGPWMYGVAYRIGLSTRSTHSRQRAIERNLAASAAQSVGRGSKTPEGVAFEHAALLHQAIMSLPERFRDVVVLCDLENISYREAATRLSVPLGTLQSRLARGRQRLRHSLIRLGVADPTASRESVSKADGIRWVGPPAVLGHRTVRCSSKFAHEPARLGEFVSASVQELMRKGLRSMLFSKLSGAAIILTTSLILGGVFVFEQRSSARPQQGARRPLPQSGPMKTAKTRDRISSKVKIIVFPPPAELRVAFGHGQLLLYALDDRGERILERPNDPNSPQVEVVREMRWAVVTGIVHHELIRDSFATIEEGFSQTGEKVAPIAPQKIYRRVDLERQSLRKDGVWSDWQSVKAELNLSILDNMPEEDFERISNHVRIGALVDPLPRLVNGHWIGADVERFVVRERMTDENGRILGVSARHPQPKPGEAPELMIRSLDFTVEPHQIYRYRARLIFFTPRDSNVAGSWSEPTDRVEIK